MAEMLRKIEDDRRRMRAEILARHIAHGLERTIQLQPRTPGTRVEDVRALLTDQSMAYLGPLVESVMILEDIIFASDGCRGHSGCMHSMEPWQRARTLLGGKWTAEEAAYFGEGEGWPSAPDRLTRD